MAVFSAEEVFQIALELEETGQVFYEAVAAACGNEQVARLCRRLAQQEAAHYKTFQQMQKRPPDDPASRPLNAEGLGYVQAMVNQRVVPDPGKAREMAAKGSLAETLDLAIRMENDSISFYTGMLDMVDGGDAEAVRRIIREEQRHAQELAVSRRSV